MASNTFFFGYNPNAYFFSPDAYIYGPIVYYNCPYAYAQPAFNNQPSFNYNGSSQNTRYACGAGTACNHAAGQRTIAAGFRPNQNINFNTGVVGGRGLNDSSWADRMKANQMRTNQRFAEQMSANQKFSKQFHESMRSYIDNI
jgi:hypothetical protein